MAPSCGTLKTNGIVCRAGSNTWCGGSKSDSGADDIRAGLEGGGRSRPTVAAGKTPVHAFRFRRNRPHQRSVYPVRALWDHQPRGIEQVLPTMKILLAEDDNDMRRFLVKALQNAGYDVASFDNGLSAYNRLREEPFELLLTDIVMPEMDGIELARRATELDPDIKVMFITGFAAVALNPDSRAPKDAKVLSKPFHLRDLVNEVQRLLAA